MSLILIITTFLLFFTLFLILYVLSTRKFKYWRNKNVPFLPPVPFFGNAFKIFAFRESFGQFTRKMYEDTKEPFVGLFMCYKPCLLIRDPELIKEILVKNFNVFSDRSICDNEKDDSMGSNLLFVLKNPAWRIRRRKMSPIFTTGKIKTMFKLLAASGNDLVKFLDEEIRKNSIINIREFLVNYTTDAITSASFGINANSFTNKDSEFKAVSKRVFNWTIWERVFAMSCYFMAPNLVKIFKLKFIDKKSSDFLRDAFWKTLNERREKRVVRNDLIDILIEFQDEQKSEDLDKLEGDKLVSLATQFFVAGSETTTTTISFTLYELAMNKEVQNKLRSEISDVMSKYREFSFEAVKEMEYLDKCIKETLRKYPVLPFLDRRCSVDYKISGTDVIVEKGTPLFIPIWGLHYDPLYYPNPEKYDPLRYTEDNLKSRPSFSYLPFGEGPRNCIGARFGTTTSKIGVAKIISEFEVDLSEKQVKLDNKGILLAPINSELLLQFRKISL